jgi:radical SAM enzyme (TIGR01210 family)
MVPFRIPPRRRDSRAGTTEIALHAGPPVPPRTFPARGPVSFPGASAGRTEFVLERRGPKNALTPDRAYGAFVEEEPDGQGGRVEVATILLTNRECPWRCVFCDLWKNTLDTTVPLGAIDEQIRVALSDLPRARWIKLYNAGSFFDPLAIPAADFPVIAARLSSFERVIVESHPRLVGASALRLRDLLRGKLEVAMGLEVANASILARLHKGMTLAEFARAAEFLRRAEIDVRAFVLVQPPFVRPEDAEESAEHSLDFAQECGAQVCALLPTRSGNGALEALAADGQFTPPRLRTLENVLEGGLRRRRSRVLADLWDLERFSGCAACFPARKERLARMNLSQKIEPRAGCAACGDLAGDAR